MNSKLLEAKKFNSHSPEDLIKALENTAKGCQKSYNLIFRAFFQSIFLYIRKKYKIESISANELTFEIMTKIWEKSAQYDKSKGHVTTWIYSITNFHVIDYFRREQTKIKYYSIYKLINMDSKTLKINYNVSIPSSNPEQIYIKKERVREFTKLFEESILGNKVLLNIMQLRYLDEFSLKDIAEKLKLNDNSVRTNIHRGKQKIKDFLLARNSSF